MYINISFYLCIWIIIDYSIYKLYFKFSIGFLPRIIVFGKLWWYTTIISALSRLKQGVQPALHCEFNVSLDDQVKLCP